MDDDIATFWKADAVNRDYPAGRIAVIPGFCLFQYGFAIRAVKDGRRKGGDPFQAASPSPANRRRIFLRTPHHLAQRSRLSGCGSVVPVPWCRCATKTIRPPFTPRSFSAERRLMKVANSSTGQAQSSFNFHARQLTFDLNFRVLPLPASFKSTDLMDTHIELSGYFYESIGN